MATPEASSKIEIASGKFSSGNLRLAGILLLVLYLIGGAIYTINLPSTIRFKDEGEYLALGDHMLHGQGYSLDGTQLTASRPPGYPFFLVPIRALGGGITSIRLVQFLLVIATILLLNRLCTENRCSSGLLIATSLVALYPILLYTSATLYPQPQAALLFILALTLLTTAPGGFSRNLTTGLTFGFLILTTPTFAFTLIVVVAAAQALQIIRWRDSLLILAAAVLTSGLWTARNILVFHQFTPVASNSGYNLLLGNSEGTVPYGGTDNIDLTHYNAETIALGLDEFQTDRYYQKAALNWIEHHPLRALVLYGEKTLNFFNVWNEYSPKNTFEIPVWKQIVMGATYATLLALLAWRLMETKRFPLTSREKLFLLVYVLSAFTSAIFVTRIRYRMPYDYLIIAIVTIHLNNRIQSWLGSPSK